MKKILFNFLLINLLSISSLFSQDIGVTAINQPQNGGCDLGTVQVQVNLFNYSVNNLIGSFDVKYVLNNETTVVQSDLNALGFGGNSARIFTFLLPVDFTNKYGDNVLTVYTDLGTDTDNSNDTIIIIITNSEPTEGGVLAKSDTICEGLNSGTLQLTGNLGSVEEWQFNEGNGWIAISNNLTTNNYNNLTVNTDFRVKVKNGECAEEFSNEISIQVDQEADAGTIEGAVSVCQGASSDTLFLKNYFGNISKWEMNDGSGWVNANNPSDTLVYSAPITTISYRAVVDTGVCSADTSDIAIVEVLPSSVGGNLSASDSVCEGLNSGTLQLTGNVGSVEEWQFNEGNGWIAIVNNSTTHNYSNLILSTDFRVKVKNGQCVEEFSNEVTIQVDQKADAGEIEGAVSVCPGTSSDTLFLKNYFGNISKWEMNDGSGWVDANNPSDTLIYSAPITTISYRAIVDTGVCNADTSNIAIVEVVLSSVGGNLFSSNTVCSGSNNDSLILENHQGNIIQWEFTEDNGSSWIPLVNADTIQAYVDLTTTRMYRTLVEASGCPAAYSDTVTITVDEISDAGTLLEDKSICGGANLDTLILIDFNSSIVKWQFNNTGSWVDTASTNDTLFVSDVFTTTSYRSIVNNGVCENDTSNEVTLTVIATTYGGEILSSDSVCKGVNFDTLNLVNHIGDIKWWEKSEDQGVSWSPLINFTTAQKYSNLISTTWYRVLVEGKNCPNDYSDTSIVTVYEPTITFSVNGDLEFCDGDSVQVSVDENYNVYLWTNGDTLQTSTVRLNGFQTVQITDENGCMNSDSIEVIVNELPAVIAGEDITISLGASTTLKGEGAFNYFWTPGGSLSDSTVATPIATPYQSIEYILKGEDVKGCVNFDSVVVTTDKDYNFKPKNIITPNGDGYNDTWNVEHLLAYPECSVSIFNRYGMLVFQTKEYTNSWDGKSAGTIVPDGTYYFLVKCPGSDLIKEGHITVLSK